MQGEFQVVDEQGEAMSEYQPITDKELAQWSLWAGGDYFGCGSDESKRLINEVSGLRHLVAYWKEVASAAGNQVQRLVEETHELDAEVNRLRAKP